MPNCLQVRKKALDFLARREHSYQELVQKLCAKEYARDLVLEVLAALSEEGLQSDYRFAENYLRARVRRGFGPLHIKHELQRRGVSEEIITALVDHGSIDWQEQRNMVIRKKFGTNNLPDNLKERAKVARFLSSRGFYIGAL